MAVSIEVRELLRVRYDYKCGYCGVSEASIGGLLEVEHFQPLSKGGTDNIENLVYACTVCNRFKSDYWGSEEIAVHLRLLHPIHDNLEEHLSELPNGMLMGLTERGWFHIEWLHLNRPQLVAFRKVRQQKVEDGELTARMYKSNVQLQQRVSELEQEIVHLKMRIKELTDLLS